LLDGLAAGHFLRVDRGAMKHTVEPRSPFCDQHFVDLAMRVSGSLKVTKSNHIVTVKSILRQVAEQFLPEYIAYRYKMPFALGAGVDVGSDFKVDDGEVASHLLTQRDVR
jgi:asparagine synthase (glutamine-hydrolysing)